jgi:hypothetical protein
MKRADNLVYSEILAALARMAADSRCQCETPGCGHSGRCNAFLEGDGWRTRYRVAPADGGADAVDNCEVVCPACHDRSMGRAPTPD